MPYSLSNRFPPSPKYFPFYDPGTYQFEKSRIKANAVSFLSKTPRKTGPGSILWTQATYDTNIPTRIQNITTLKSTTKRFSYENFSTKDLEEFLCKCGFDNACECPVSEKVSINDIVCQGKVKRRWYKGIALQSENKSSILRPQKHESPPFYNATVHESTEFYHGCKWSQRTSKRSPPLLEKRPGPTDYYLERNPTEEEICAEKVRAYKRKTSKQLRFLEMVQAQNIREGRPGPSAYSPTNVKGTDLQYLGPKAVRFAVKNKIYPGPADHDICRDFDLPVIPDTTCQAALPEPSCFGVKAQRFRFKPEQGPGPASYNVEYKPCQFMHCPTTPFLSSAVRFKQDIFEESDDEDTSEKSLVTPAPCQLPLWMFKSKTIRMKPLEKKYNEAGPADLPQSKHKIRRDTQLQYAAPFYTSEGRFLPWFSSTPIHGKLQTPGPGYYKLDAQTCYPAFNNGPMFRAERFPSMDPGYPAPNEYHFDEGITTILRTFNNRLSENIKNRHQFVWVPPQTDQGKSLDYNQKEALLFQKCIALLEPEENIGSKRHTGRDRKSKSTFSRGDGKKYTKGEENKPKMLRTFLYARQVPNYF